MCTHVCFLYKYKLTSFCPSVPSNYDTSSFLSCSFVLVTPPCDCGESVFHYSTLVDTSIGMYYEVNPLKLGNSLQFGRLCEPLISVLRDLRDQSLRPA